MKHKRASSRMSNREKQAAPGKSSQAGLNQAEESEVKLLAKELACPVWPLVCQATVLLILFASALGMVLRTMLKKAFILTNSNPLLLALSFSKLMCF